MFPDWYHQTESFDLKLRKEYYLQSYYILTNNTMKGILKIW